MESAHRRSVSSSTCSLDKITSKAISNGGLKEGDGAREVGVNGFLKKQRSKIGKIFRGEVNARAKIILSGPSNSTSSMIAAICYAWLLENRMNKSKGEGNGGGSIAVPMMNVRRAKMWKQRQAAWLFHHVGLDATSLLFADEVDLESLVMAGKLSILVVGQDVLKTTGEVGSQCTVLTDNYCEEAYDLLETEVLKKLLLAGILLDTRNLNATGKLSTTRDAEAVQLLLVGSAPTYRNTLFDQLMQDPQDSTFTESLQQNYGKPPSESSSIAGSRKDHRVPERKSTSVHSQEGIKKGPEKNHHDAKTAKTDRVSPKPDKQNPNPVQPSKKESDAGRGKNTFFLARWFGFGPK